MCKRIIMAAVMIFVLFLGTQDVHAIGLSRENIDSLQSIVDTADEGDTIFLEDKDYDGPLIIDKSVTIVGNGCKIIGDGKTDTIVLSADGIELDNILVTVEGSKCNLESSSILIKSNYNKIRHCTIRQSHYGLHLENANNNYIYENQIIGDGGIDISDKGAGIMLEYSSDNTFEDNKIGEVQDGLYFYYANDNIIRNNNITESRYGLHLMDCSARNQLLGNTLDHNVTGIMAMLAEDTIIEGNEIKNQYDYHGVGLIVYECLHTTIKANVITDNTYGIQMSHATDTTILNNIVSQNSIGLILGEALTGNEIYENNFVGNVRQYSVLTQESIKLYSGNRGNYWDDYDGHDIEGDGIGSKPYVAGKKYFEYIINLRNELQLFFNSPAMILLDVVKSPDTKLDTMDQYPLVLPTKYIETAKQNNASGLLWYIVLSLIMIAVSLFIFLVSRKTVWEYHHETK